MIGQQSHAWLAGQLARAWGNPRFGPVEPREEIVLGAAQHDLGWALADLAPRLNPDTRLPRSFVETTVAEHLAIWADAPDRLLTQSLCAALVVSLHGCALSELRSGRGGEDTAPLLAHIAAEHARQAQLRAALGLSTADSERIQRQMWAWDSLSLALCNAWQPFIVRGVPAAEGPLDLELRQRDENLFVVDPWPFEGPRVEVRCEARELGEQDDEAAMREALRRAAPVTLRFQLTPPRG